MKQLKAICKESGGVAPAAVAIGTSPSAIYRALKTDIPGPGLRLQLEAYRDGGAAGEAVAPVASAAPPNPTPPPAEETAKPAQAIPQEVPIIGAAVAGLLLGGPLLAGGAAVLADLLMNRAKPAHKETPPRTAPPQDYKPRKSAPGSGAPTLHSWEDPP